MSIRVRMASRLEFLDSIQGLSERLFAEAGFSEEETYWPVLAIREAVCNAVMHGNGERPDTYVHVVYTVGPDGLEISVCDEGAGFDPDALADPLAEENLLKIAGRGIFLIRQFMDAVSFDFPDEGGTRISMVKHRPGETGQAEEGP